MVGMRYNGALIISAFPACGKKYVTKKFNLDPYRLSYVDKDRFYWDYDEDGNMTDIKNPKFIKEYLDDVRQKSIYRDFVFVSSDKEVRDAMIESNIPFIMVYPVVPMKQEIIRRMKKRGDNPDYIRFQEEHFEQLVDEVENDLISRLDDIPVALYQIDHLHPYIDQDMLEYLDQVY